MASHLQVGFGAHMTQIAQGGIKLPVYTNVIKNIKETKEINTLVKSSLLQCRKEYKWTLWICI